MSDHRKHANSYRGLPHFYFETFLLARTAGILVFLTEKLADARQAYNWTTRI